METTENKKTATYLIEVEKGLDWENGYLNANGNVSEIKDAENFFSIEMAQETANLFNIKYGRHGRIYARVI